MCSTVPPVANFSASSTTICAGSSISFTDLSQNSPTSWNWTFAGGTPSVSTTQNPNVTYNTPGVYSVTLTAVNGHGNNTAVFSNYIVVNSIPFADAGNNTTICTGNSTVLNASGGTSYSWSPSTGLNSTNISNPIASPTANTTYTVRVTNNGCSQTDIVTVSVTPQPIANAGSDVNLCIGSTANLNATGGTTYSWTPATGLSSTTISNPIVNTTVTTTYTVYVGNAGCSAADIVVVNVNSLPVVDAGTNTVICNGNSVTLNAIGGSSYTWTPSSSLNFPNSISPVANPTATTIYTLTASNGTCSAKDVVTVSVTPLPNAYAGTDVSICSGSSTTLTASGGTSYSWTPATGLNSTTISNPIANPSVTTDYTVIVTNNNCSSSDIVRVTINSTLLADAGTSTVICNGQSTQLNGSGGNTYSWTPSFGLNSTVAANPIASPSVTTVYTLTAYSGACSATDVVTITVNPTPTVAIANSGNSSFCDGNSVTLTASSANSYTWSTGTNASFISVITSGNYYVSITDNNGCSNTSSVIAITVYTPAVTNITANGPTTFCSGNSVILSANTGTNYSWSTGATSQSISVNSSGTYSVSVDDPNGCGTGASSITITVNPNPTAPVVTANGATSICLGDAVIFTSDAADHYLWNTGATTPSISVTTAGNYSVTNYNSFNCGTTSSVISVAVNDPLADFTASSTLVFIPNAATSFSANTTGFPPYNYQWEFGDGSSSGLASPNHTYNVVAFNSVSLTVTDNTGCSKTIVKPNYIQVEQLFPSTGMSTGTTFNINGVSFQDPEIGIITLEDGNCGISVDSGKVFTPLPTGNTEPLTGVCALPGKWVVIGKNGTVLQSVDNGANWAPIVSGTTEDFHAVHCATPTSGHIVGKNGTIHKYNGSSLLPETSGTIEHLNGIFEMSNGNAVAVGDNQTILSYNGVSWSPQTSPINFNIKDVRFSDLQHGYVVGSNGNVLQTSDGGNSWLPSLTGVDVDFNSVDVAGADTAWTTGSGGIVYKTVDNGNNWVRYSVGYTDNQSQLRVTKGGKGHVVGNAGNGRYFNDNQGNGTPTSITVSNNILNNIQLYPNPARDQFIISGYIQSTQKVIIEIKDAQAKLVKQITDTKISGEYYEKITTDYYSPGVYFIHIQIGNQSMVKKLVIMK